MKALKAVQEQETLLATISEVLNAPIDKLDKTADKIVKDYKELQLEKRRLIKELAAKESIIPTSVDSAQVLEVEGITVIKRNFGEVIDVNRMVQTASEVIKLKDSTVTLYYGSDGKTCRLMVMAGQAATKKGVNAGLIVKEVAPIFGGGGGGKPNFAQGGGIKCDKLHDTVVAAEEAIKKQLKH